MDAQYHLDHSFFYEPRQYGSTLLYQVGRRYCDVDTVVAPHLHMPFFELTVVTDGRGTVITNGAETAVSRGDIYLSLPCDTHEIRVDPADPLKYDYIAVASETPVLHEELDALSEAFHSPHARVFQDDRIRRVVGHILSEINDDRPYGDDLLSSLLTQVIIYLIRDFKNLPPIENVNTVAPAEVLCYRLMHYIDTHIYSMKHLEELSQLTGYSYGYLSALFKRTTERTLSGYYQEKRLDAAALLVSDPRLTVTEVADMLNYASVYSFSKAFRKRYGVSPRAWRETHNKV